MTDPAQLERRIGQRFSYLLPVSFRDPGSAMEGLGFTQDVSSRGVFFLTDAPLREGSEIELTLKMPSEITLGKDMRVRARGQILRVSSPGGSGSTPRVEGKVGVAVRFDSYEYLPEQDDASVSRVTALHPRRETEEGASRLSRTPAQG